MISLRSISAYSLVALLAACGGGGGGGSTGGGGGTVTPPINGQNMSQSSVQRADVQGMLAGVQAQREYGGGSSTVLSRQRAALGAAVERAQREGMFGGTRAPLATATSAPGCSNGSVSSTVAGPNGSTIVSLSVYYDSLCTQIEDTIVWTATQTGNVVAGPATISLYSTTGTQTETSSGQIQFVYNSSNNLTGISFLLTSIMSGGKPQGQLALGCSVTSSVSESCGVAVAADVYSQSLEDGANVSFTATSSGSGSTFSMQTSEYQSAIEGLSIAAAGFPDWAISPSSAQTGSITIAGTQTASSISLTATDATNGGSVTISGSPSGTLSGTITRSDTQATVGTFTVDANGNGTLTYGNGTQVSIFNYTVQG